MVNVNNSAAALGDQRTDCFIMGKLLGSYNGWDQMDAWILIFYKFQPNELGRQFLPGLPESPVDLIIDFEHGEVMLNIANRRQLLLQTNWGLFNRTTPAEREE